MLRAVGLIGEGEIGVDGGSGDLRARGVAMVVVGRASASFGRAARASMVANLFDNDRGRSEDVVLTCDVNRDKFLLIEISPEQDDNDLINQNGLGRLTPIFV